MKGYTLLNTNQLQGLPYRTELICVDLCGNVRTINGKPIVEYYCNTDLGEAVVVVQKENQTCCNKSYGVPMSDGICYLVSDVSISEKLR